MATIQGIYIALFGRPADPAGLAFFNEQTNNGADLTAIGDLAATDEYQDRFDGLNNVQIVTKIYQDLFGRDPDAAGLAFFVAALNAGTLDINTVAINILDGAQGDDAAVVANKIASADLFTAAIDTAIEIGSYVGDDAAAAGRNFLSGITADEATVKTAEQAATAVQDIVDAGVAGNDISVLDAAGVVVGDDINLNSTNNNDIIRVTDAYTGAANINGGLGTDTVYIEDIAAGQTANLTSIERLFVTASAAAALDLVNVDGLTQVWNEASAAALTVDNIDAGTVLGMSGAITGDTTFNLEDATADDDAVTIVLDTVVTGDDIIVADVETVTVNVAAESEMGELVAAAAETVTVTGTGNLTLEVALAEDATFDASAHVGVLDVTVNAAQDGLTVVGGASNDIFNVASGAEGIVITGGAGNDLFNVNVANLEDVTDLDIVLDDIIQITDFAGANDLLDINAGATATSLDNIELGNIAAADDIVGALGVVAAAANTDGAAYAVFQYEGSTYVYVDNGAAGLDNGDGLVELVGFTGDLDASNFVSV